VKAPKRISLIIPAYNEERYLGRCLDSVKVQQLQPYEVIVVDNGSTDATAVIARQYDFVQVVSEPQRGRVFARNTGFSAARGDIIARIDADAILPPDWMARLDAHYAQAERQDGAWTGGALFYNVRLPHLVSWLYNVLVFRLNHLLTGHAALWGSNMAVPRQQWLAVRAQVCNRNDIHEDLDLAEHLYRAGVQITYDRHTKVRAQLRRVRSNRRELWNYLQMWPRTLRIHGIKSWPICWLFGDFLLYALTPLLTVSEYLARLFGRQPLEDES